MISFHLNIHTFNLFLSVKNTVRTRSNLTDITKRHRRTKCKPDRPATDTLYNNTTLHRNEEKDNDDGQKDVVNDSIQGAINTNQARESYSNDTMIQHDLEDDTYVNQDNEMETTWDTAQMPNFCVARYPVNDGIPLHDLGRMNVECPFCRALHWLDERVASTSSSRPEFESCCQRGKIILPNLTVPPTALYNLFVADTIQGKEFRKNITQYNAALAFTSMGVDVDRSIVGRGPPVFRIHGELTHLAGSLLPESGKRPTYAQLYIHDPLSAYQSRIVRNSNLSLSTLGILQQIMNDNNEYHSLYTHTFVTVYRIIWYSERVHCAM
ncbi:hypothetical protein BDZ97DRAFT_1913321 [Flammula alnicola]|nr:hypothetical protein BDZ97DRAFT_1913321 [Flammula alnicola]